LFSHLIYHTHEQHAACLVVGDNQEKVEKALIPYNPTLEEMEQVFNHLAVSLTGTSEG
jgi:hypothetical protein